MLSDPQASWTNPRILVTLLLIFLCGSLAGALVIRYAFQPEQPQPAAYWTKGGKDISLQRFERELSLTPEQSKTIEMILDDFVMYYDTLQSQMDEVRASGKGRIMEVLTTEQREKFKTMLDDFHSKRIE